MVEHWMLDANSSGCSPDYPECLRTVREDQ